MSGPRDALLALVRDAIQAGVERALDDERVPPKAWKALWPDRHALVLDVLSMSDDWPEYDAVLALLNEPPSEAA